MAILIPSARIYSIENSKIIDNNIEKIEFNCSKATTPTENNVLFDNTSASSGFAFESSTSETKVFSAASNGYIYVAHLSVTPQYARNLQLQLPRSKGRKYLKILYDGVDEENKPQIKYTIHYTKSIADATAKYDRDVGLYNIQVGAFTGNTNEIASDPIVLPEEYVFREQTIEHDYQVVAVVDVADETTLGSPITIGSDSSTFRLRFDLLTGYEELTLGGFSNTHLGLTNNTLTGQVERHTARKVDFSFYGDVISVDLETITEKLPDNSSQKSLSIPNNELLQKDYTHGTTNALKYFGGKVLDEYRNGKETFTIRCSVNDYYEYDPNTDDKKGALAISIKNDNLPMTFNMYDRVVPMVATAIGIDRPLSRYKDGTPKVFRILKRTISNKGIIFQEIHGQEVSQTQTTETTSSFFITWSRSGFTYTDTYYFNEGMTWQEWVNSSYNTDGFAIAKLGVNKDKIVKTIDNENHKVVYLNGNEQTDVVYANKIQANTIYELLPTTTII